MSTVRRLVLLLVAITLIAGLYHAFRPWGWSAPLNTPPGVKAQTANYTCGPLWGSAYVHGPATTAYPVEGIPCAQRQQYRVMVVADVAVAALAVVFLYGVPVLRRREKALPAG